MAGAWHSLRDRLNSPNTVTELLQLLKTVIAGTAAWWVSSEVFHSQLPFLSPWVALLTVQATVYRSLKHGMQTTVASALGTGMSFLIGNYLGVSAWTFALALLVGVLAAKITWIKDEGIAIATTAVFILGDGFTQQGPQLVDRIVEICVGVVIGIAVNLLVIPPLRDRQAASYVDSVNRRIGDVLTNMADEFATSWETDKADRWFDETQSISQELDSAWTVVQLAKESRKVNPRGRRPALAITRRSRQPDPRPEDARWEVILGRADEGVSHVRNLARTLRDAAYAEGEWDDEFRRRWAALTRDTGQAVADPDAAVEPLYDRLTALANDLATGDRLPHDYWPTYGSLITSLRHIVVVIDDVASAREARE